MAARRGGEAPWPCRLNEAEFRTPPMVLLIGPYSVGKTTFIEYLLGRNFPGQRVGPEPTTDRFCAVMYGEDERTIPGNALTVAPNSPGPPKGASMSPSNSECF